MEDAGARNFRKRLFVRLCPRWFPAYMLTKEKRAQKAATYQADKLKIPALNAGGIQLIASIKPRTRVSFSFIAEY